MKQDCDESHQTGPALGQSEWDMTLRLMSDRWVTSSSEAARQPAPRWLTVASTRFAITWFANPSAASSTIRARNAVAAGTVADRVKRSSSVRSPVRRASGSAVLFATRRCLPLKVNIFHRHTTSGVSRK